MVNIHDVARAAGVSTASVSRHLAGKKVRAAGAVEAAITELGFTPSALAQSLKSGQHQAIGVVVPDVTNPFFAALVKGIDQEARAAGYQVILGGSDEDPQQEAALLAALARRTDGIIAAPVLEDDLSLQGLDGRALPVVLVDRDVPLDTRFDRVLADNAAGSRMAVEHLVALGHTAIAVISGPLASTPGRARHEGFLSAMAERGVAAQRDLIRVSDFREDGGYASMTDLWRRPTRPTAVFVANNLMTIGALKALRDLAARVPEDISLIGFDDLSFADLLNPPLTVIRRPDVEQGAAAARLLFARLTDKTGAGEEGETQTVTLPVALVVRSSTAQPAEPSRLTDLRTDISS